MTVLITGGAGFIGSHCCVVFLEAGYDVVVVDNLSNSHFQTLKSIASICGRDVEFVQADIRDQPKIENVLRDYSCQSVIHFAGLKAVGESVHDPLSFYDNNVVGTHRLLSAMNECGVRQLVFSSSATVYGDPQFLPLTESHPLAPINPYGQTKFIVEQMLQDVAASSEEWRFSILRYFNPTGAHESGLIGEDPAGPPNNLMPLIVEVADGRRESLSILGSDYDTPDGTGVRDYVHVMDLVEGHLRAHDQQSAKNATDRCFTCNLGTGKGYSVLEMVRAFERASNRTISLNFASRRSGDVAESYADTHLAEDTLKWKAERDISVMCHDIWNWHCKDENQKQYVSNRTIKGPANRT